MPTIRSCALVLPTFPLINDLLPFLQAICCPDSPTHPLSSDSSPSSYPLRTFPTSSQPRSRPPFRLLQRPSQAARSRISRHRSGHSTLAFPLLHSSLHTRQLASLFSRPIRPHIHTQCCAAVLSTPRCPLYTLSLHTSPPPLPPNTTRPLHSLPPSHPPSAYRTR